LQLNFKRFEETFHPGIIPAIAFTAPTDPKVMPLQFGQKKMAPILASLI
jgi:hypothetical protein